MKLFTHHNYVHSFIVNCLSAYICCLYWDERVYSTKKKFSSRQIIFDVIYFIYLRQNVVALCILTLVNNFIIYFDFNL